MTQHVATDLHGHSLFSDGRATPEEYVAFRVKRRFDVIALSDHDTFAGLPRAAAALHTATTTAAATTTTTLVPAMETTSFIHFGTERAEQIHVLAYFPPAFLDDGRLWKTRLHQRSQKIASAWKRYVLDFLARQPQHVRDALDEKALAATAAADFPQLQSFILRISEKSPESFSHFQLDHAHFWDRDGEGLFSWSPEEMIDAIRKDGALDVVAHPNRARDKDRLAQVIDYASGVEAYTSRHTPDVAARFRALAESKGKHWTASSDDHQHRVYFQPQSGTPRRTVDRIVAGR